MESKECNHKWCDFGDVGYDIENNAEIMTYICPKCGETKHEIKKYE